jgi:ElaB/YqjD/DUF883 family membrane-anchored ribosome-binding protein
MAEPAAKVAPEATAAELQDQIALLKRDIAELTATVAKYGREQSANLKAQAQAHLRNAKETGAERLSEAGDYAARKVADTEDYVRENPATAVGIAAGIGFVVGLIMSRR